MLEESTIQIDSLGQYYTRKYYRTVLYKRILGNSTVQKILEDSTMQENTRRKYHTNRYFRTILYKKILDDSTMKEYTRAEESKI